MKILFILLQYLLPKQFISNLFGRIADSKNIRIKNTFISYFLKKIDVNMKEAVIEDPFSYDSFNDFFTREIKMDLRSIDNNETTITSPCDGLISQFGEIENSGLIQAKGKKYSLLSLMGGEKEDIIEFQNGSFITVYLAPKDYHRVHMPYTGILRSMTYIPGNLFSVNLLTADSVNNLFSRNERLVSIFDTANGPIAMILVGALIVSGIQVVWEQNNFQHYTDIKKWNYNNKIENLIKLRKGEEMGRFKLGSTVILITPNKKINWNKNIATHLNIKMGQSIGKFINAA